MKVESKTSATNCSSSLKTVSSKLYSTLNIAIKTLKYLGNVFFKVVCCPCFAIKKCVANKTYKKGIEELETETKEKNKQRVKFDVPDEVKTEPTSNGTEKPYKDLKKILNKILEESGISKAINDFDSNLINSSDLNEDIKKHEVYKICATKLLENYNLHLKEFPSSDRHQKVYKEFKLRVTAYNHMFIPEIPLKTDAETTATYTIATDLLENLSGVYKMAKRVIYDLEL